MPCIERIIPLLTYRDIAAAVTITTIAIQST